MTLYSAFLTTETESPAEMSSTVAPSFWACFTDEFINTVQREPKSDGFLLKRPSLANSSTLYPIAFANVSMKEPQPDEHASLSIIESIAPLRIRKHFMS